MENFIEKHKEILEKKLHEQCKLFNPKDRLGLKSPRWMNFREVKEGYKPGTYILVIGSTQLSRITFEIPIEWNEYLDLTTDVEPFWKSFRNFRTQFLKDNYPAINPY